MTYFCDLQAELYNVESISVIAVYLLILIFPLKEGVYLINSEHKTRIYNINSINKMTLSPEIFHKFMNIGCFLKFLVNTTNVGSNKNEISIKNDLFRDNY